MADEVVKGLNEIASVLRCSAEEVRYYVNNCGLPVIRKDGKGVYRSTTGLLIGWMERQAEGGHGGNQEKKEGK